MPDTSAVLGLPYLMPSQAQKHVTHNEALRLLDLVVQLAVAGLEADDPPSTPDEGEIWGLGAAPTGVWAGQAGMLAAWVGGVWTFLTPLEGWRAWDRDTGALRVWDGAAWALPGGETQNLASLGIATTADAVNRLSVRAPAVLLSHDGAGHQVKVNKAASGDTASLLFQTGFAGHAEMGLAGTDDFALKVSADGSAWATALAADAASGTVGFPAGVTLAGGTAALDAYEKGSWTPEAADAASGGTAASATTATGRYTRIGEQVFATFTLEGIDTAGLTAGNTLFLRGLPYPVRNVASSQFTAPARVADVSFAQSPVFYAAGGDSALRLMQNVSGAAPGFLTVAALTSGSADICGSFFYRV